MKKSEKIISALLTMALGVMFVILKDKFIGLMMTLAGVSLIVLGIMDIVGKSVPPAIVKIVAGVLLIVAGWVVVEAVLYILSGILLVFGGLFLYDLIKNSPHCSSVWEWILQFATPVICILIGVLLLFQRDSIINFILIVSGCLAILEGGVLLIDALSED